jgi:hypothetical protein
MAQNAIYFLVSAFVTLQLGQPVILIAAWLAAMLGTTVPKTTIYEHGKALFQKNEIGITGQRLVSAPTFDSVRTKNGCQLQFGVFIAFRSDGSHHLRTFPFRKDIGH